MGGGKDCWADPGPHSPALRLGMAHTLLALASWCCWDESTTEKQRQWAFAGDDLCLLERKKDGR